MNPDAADRPSRAPAWLAAALVAACLILNLIWEGGATPSFGGFDEANHLGRIWAFAEQEMGRAQDVELNQPLHWPPTVHEGAAKLWLLTERSHIALKIAWTLMLAIILVAVYFLATDLTDSWGGLAAVTLAATAPPVATYSRAVTLDMPLAMMTALTLFALVRSRGFRHLGYSVAFGLAAGVSCLAKGYAPAYWMAPAAIAFFAHGSFVDLNKRGYENPLFNLAVGSVFGALMMSWWYGGRLAQWLQTLTGHVQSYQQSGALDGAWPLGRMIYGDMGPLLPAILVAGLVLGWPARRTQRSVYEIMAALLIPAALFAVAPTTYARFLMPALGAGVVLFVVGLWRLPFPTARRWVVGVLAALSLLLHVALALAPTRAADALGMFARPPQSDPQAVALAECAATVGPVVIVDDAWHPYLPAGMLAFLVRRADGEVHITAADTERDDEAAVVAAIRDIDVAGSLLVLREGSGLPFDESVLRPFTLKREAAWRFGARQPRLQCWIRSDAE
ncbi:MAG: glycosyltransferase family 39 protein [Candidatus Lernaella stagnicola]|nr:glycosyltransferase family 39 protein [Candidatus Lernaella stagnicola]